MKTIPKSLAVLSLSLASALAASAQVNITTWQVNNQHTGANLNETILTPAIVSAPGSFGLLFEQPMDGQVYGQPLIMSGLNIGGTTHNVVYLATQHDTVYAFDADNNVGPNTSPLWQKSLLPAGAEPVPQSEVHSSDILDKLSITATPVIDPVSQTIYVVSKYKITATDAYVQRLHALDLKTGAEKFGGPVVLNPTFAGSASDGTGGVIPFHPLEAHARPALTLYNGVVYIMYSSHSDHTPYHGEILGYDASTLALVKTFIATPNGMQAGIWQGGASAAIDTAGNMYIATGNGPFDQASSPYTTGTNWGESFVKLPTTGTFSVSFSNPLNWFTPNNWATLNGNDLDLGSSGILLLPDQAGPHPHLMVGGGKGGTLYVIDRDSMGGLHSPDNSVQEITETNGLFVTPAYFNGNIYYAPGGGKLTQRAVGYNATTGGYLSTTPNKSTFTYNGGHGSHVFISANGTSNGLVWTLDLGTPAHLHAYNASNVSGNPIFTGSATLSGGANCTGPKFSVPTVANGKVYFTAYDSGNAAHLFVFSQPAPTAGTPTAPSNPVATANTSSQITLTWTDNSNNESGFTIKRATSASGPFVALVPNSNANATSFTDTGLNPATTYYYQVLAFNSNGNSTPSVVASAATFPLFKPAGLAAYWNFDEGTGGVANDVTGNGLNGSVNGEFTWIAGFNNNAISFHGTGEAISNVTVPNSSALQFAANQSFTVSAWVFPGSLNGIYEAVFAKSRDTGNYYGIWINPSNQWVFRGPGGDVVGSAATVSTWTHVAVVQDGAAGTRKIYINGSLAGSGSAQAADGSGPLWIGQANSGGGVVADSFPGAIDEVRLYNRALSATEITTLLGPPVLQSLSRQVQGAAGTFDRILSPANSKVLEPRKGATAGQYSLVLSFGAPVSGITATLGLQGGGAASGSIGAPSYSTSGKVVTIPLTGVANVQGLNVHLAGIQPGNGTADLPFNVLWGDVNQDNIVSNADVTLVQNNHTATVTSATAFFDLNCDGAVNATDDSIVSSLVGTNLGPQLDSNVALGLQAIASSVQGTDVAVHGNDGNLTTRWTAADGTFPQWWRVDLGSSQVLSRVDIAWYSSASRSYKYKIEVSPDDATYTTAVDKTGNTTLGDTSDSFIATARYVRVTVTGSSAGFASLFEVSVLGHAAGGGGSAPAITSPSTASGTQGSAFSYQITATNSPTSFAATGLPTGLSVNASTGLISGTPSVSGSFSVGLSAANGSGTSPAFTLGLTIAAAGSPPTITSSSTASGTQGSAFSYQITATNSPTSFAATGLPTGLTVNASTGLISGIPSVSGSFSVGLSAANGSGTSPAFTLGLTVATSGDTNLALGQQAIATSFQVGNVVANGNDASTTSRWAAADATYPQSWRVDLGASKVLSRVDIMWYSSTSRAYKYKLETSTDDAAYTTAFDNTGNTTFGNTSDAITATARYVRITMTGSTASGAFASFFDVKVFGH